MKHTCRHSNIETLSYSDALSLYKNVAVLGSKKPRQVLTFLKGLNRKVFRYRLKLAKELHTKNYNFDLNIHLVSTHIYSMIYFKNVL